jgi:ArsR family transcriptional regulator
MMTYDANMETETPDRSVFDCLAQICKALGHTHRLLILQHLAQGENSVDALAERTDLSVANASQHLQQLRHAHLVQPRREGKRTLYRLSDEAVVTLISAVRLVAEHQAGEIARIAKLYFQARDGLEPVSRQEVIESMQRDELTVLDVRLPDEFARGHLPNARNIPLDELEQRLDELPREKEIVAYCRGPYCVLAYEAVALLRSRGRKARRLEEGLPEWRAAALPVETESLS